MRKFIWMTCIAVWGTTLSGQISEGGLPPSYKNTTLKSASAVSTLALDPVDDEKLMEYNNANSLPMRYAVLENVSADLKSVATSTFLTEGGIIWRYKISSTNAKSLQVLFDKYFVPDGAELYIYNEDYSFIKGAYTEMNMREDLSFVVGDIPGNSIIIEYYEPSDIDFAGEIIIGKIGQGYLDVFNSQFSNEDANGYIAANCSEGAEWQNQKHSVCKITFNDGEYSYLCSGGLMNNVNVDATPYFLTAYHCINAASEATTIVAYFNYENAACENVSLYTNQTLSGATLKSMGVASDYTLVLFNDIVPESYKPYYAGWDASGTPPESSAGIHHPEGLKKKISIDEDPATLYDKTISWSNGTVTPIGSHWAVLFDKGVTNSGSSGSPLFNQDKRVVGQLHGGSSTDYYGSLTYSWNNSSSGYQPLKTFLDPSSTGTKILDGYYPSGNLPDAQFSSAYSLVCVDSPVEISGFSAFDPLAWEWSFSPATVEYTEGTSASSQRPKVAFSQSGDYDVTLKVTNTAGDNQLTLNNVITAGSTISLQVEPVDLADSCICNFSGITLEAFGADSYLWSLSEESDDYFYIVNNTSNPAEIKLIDGVSLTESTDVDIILSGTQGTCQKTISLTIPLESQPNDNIASAIDLSAGSNGPYSNSCATIETGEPIPPYESCTGVLSWCDEYGTGENIVENSVWFRYSSTSSQTVRIASTGFDNEIAIYKANSYNDVLTGNYTLIAANDDFSGSDYNPKVTFGTAAGQNYWIQVDGSGGGLTGTFYLQLSVLSSSESTVESDESVIAYPLPACDYVYLESPAFNGNVPVTVEIFNAAGSKVSQLKNIVGSERLYIPVADLPAGLYTARVVYNNKIAVLKIVKQ